jgi:cyclopropane-fatty-acyl-phospholipid synthase
MPIANEHEALSTSVTAPDETIPIPSSTTSRGSRHADRDPRWIAVAETVLDMLFGPVEQRSFAVQLWTGALDVPAERTPHFTLILAHPGSLRRMLLPPSELALGEAFVHGDVWIEGDLEAAAALLEVLQHRLADPAVLLRVMALVLSLPRTTPRAAHDQRDPERRARPHTRKHTLRRDAAAVRSHYDVGNDFYALWLDPNLVYSCAYFPTPDTSLADAQVAKFDLLCRKLRLMPGEHLLDIGCGWGGLVRHAAKYYGVRALGITLSPEQARVARERIRTDGLEERCTVHILDYRAVEGNAIFDKIVSVGMVEHVGRQHLPDYFGAAFRLLRPGGLMLSHGIVEAERYQSTAWRDRMQRHLWRRGTFIDRYVFPDGELVPVGTMATAAERCGFEVRDAESLREHYARTLRHWTTHLRQSWDDAVAIVGIETARTWWLYMAASAHAFASGRLNLVQLLLGKQTADGRVHIPPTREDIYASRPTADHTG